MYNEYEKAKKRIENIYNKGSDLIYLSAEEKNVYSFVANKLLEEQVANEEHKKAMYTAEKALYLANNPVIAGNALTYLLISASKIGLTIEGIYPNDQSSVLRLEKIPGGLGREILHTVYMNKPSYPFVVPLLLLLSGLFLVAACTLIFLPEIAIMLAGVDGMNIVYATIAVIMIVSVLLFNNKPFQIYKAAAVTIAIGGLLIAITNRIPIEIMSRFSPSLGFLVVAIVAYLGYRKMKIYQKKIDYAYCYAEKVVAYAKKILENARSGSHFSTIDVPEYIDIYCKDVEREIILLEKGLTKRRK